jgi:hypothetical protein
MKIRYSKANKIRTVLATLVIVLIWISCNKSIINTLNTETPINILINDKNSVDLLNPNTYGNYNTENIKLFYLKDGELTEYSEPNINSPHGYSIDFENGRWYLKLFPHLKKNNIPTTYYIKWNFTDTDTITFQYNENSNNVNYAGIHVNGTNIEKSRNKYIIELIK